MRSPNAPVAQLDRVPGYEPVGRGFESLQACQEKKQPLSARQRLFLFTFYRKAKYFIIRRITSYCIAIFHLECYNICKDDNFEENKLVDLSMDFAIQNVNII